MLYEVIGCSRGIAVTHFDTTVKSDARKHFEKMVLLNMGYVPAADVTKVTSGENDEKRITLVSHA